MKSPSPVASDLNGDWTHQCVGGALRIHRGEGPKVDVKAQRSPTHFVVFPRVEYRFKWFSPSGTQVVTRRPGEVVFVPAGTTMEFQLIDQFVDYVAIAIPSEFFDRVTQRPSVPLAMFLSTDPVLASFQHTFAQIGESQASGGSEVLEALFTALCHQLSRVMELDSADWNKITRPELRRVIRAIHQDPSHHWTVEELAGDAGISCSQLNRLFRQHLGSSVGDYVIQTRLFRAADLLRSTPDSIEGIALQCGFYDASHLGRHFRKMYGQAPAHYRMYGPLRKLALLATLGRNARSIPSVE